jgi:hypothetical protein
MIPYPTRGRRHQRCITRTSAEAERAMEYRLDIEDGTPSLVQFLGEEIVKLIHELFPGDTEFGVAERDRGILVRVNWPLRDDAARPNKMSKFVHLIVTREAVEDYLKDERTIGTALDAIAEFVRVRLASFDPTHETAVGGIPPVVRWIVTPSTIGNPRDARRA